MVLDRRSAHRGQCTRWARVRLVEISRSVKELGISVGAHAPRSGSDLTRRFRRQHEMKWCAFRDLSRSHTEGSKMTQPACQRPSFAKRCSLGNEARQKRDQGEEPP